VKPKKSRLSMAIIFFLSIGIKKSTERLANVFIGVINGGIPILPKHSFRNAPKRLRNMIAVKSR
jgi:hypothetical protein